MGSIIKDNERALDRAGIRLEVSKIFIKWSLGTRQVAIIEIANLVERQVELRMASKDKGRKEIKKKKKDKKK